MDEELTQLLTFNVFGKATIHKFKGRDHFVVPIAMLPEGVFIGDKGPVLYEEGPLEESVIAWNNMPSIVYHPGADKSARTFNILNAQDIGPILDTVWDKRAKKLRTKGYYDCERTREVDPRVYDAIKTGKRMNVSTGIKALVLKNENGATWRGKSYLYKCLKVIPDHLAILPDMQGACSIEQGAGMFVMNQEGIEIQDVSPTHVIYVQNGSMMRQEYIVNADGKFVLDGEALPIKREVTYQLVDGDAAVAVTDPVLETEVHNMDPKKALIDQLISKGLCAEEDRAEYMKMGEAQLKKLSTIQVSNANPPVVDPPPVVPPAVITPPAVRPMTSQEWLDAAPADMRNDLLNKRKADETEKNHLVEQLVANAKCPFDKPYLDERSIEELQGLMLMAGTDTTDVHNAATARRPIFKGASGAPSAGPAAQVTVLELPATPKFGERLNGIIGKKVTA